jgi:hypothetical protein
MFTNAMLLGSKLAEGRREFQKDLGRPAEGILKDASVEDGVLTKGHLPTNLLPRQVPNCAGPLMPARCLRLALRALQK